MKALRTEIVKQVVLALEGMGEEHIRRGWDSATVTPAGQDMLLEACERAFAAYYATLDKSGDTILFEPDVKYTIERDSRSGLTIVAINGREIAECSKAEVQAMADRLAARVERAEARLGWEKTKRRAAEDEANRRGAKIAELESKMR